MNKFLLAVLFFPSFVMAQDMKFRLEERCMSTGQSLSFKCQRHDLEFTIRKKGGKYISLNTRSGWDEDMRVLQDDSEMLVLQEPVGYSGTSTLHVTKSDNRFYWVQIGYSSVLKAREITIESGTRVR
jgi:hypothetical protein